MVRNRNGYWMDPRFAFLRDADEGASGGGATGASAGNGTAENAQGGADSGEGEKGNDPGTEDLSAEITRLKAEMEKQKEALNKATSEAAGYKRELRSKMTQEQIDAQNKQEADEKTARELEELRKEVAKSRTVKTVMGKLGTDEETSGKIADALYGADDIENAMLLLQKVWTAREKALRQEFGKIPGPGAGSADGENSAEQKAIELAKRLGRERAETSKSVATGLQGYIR